MALFKRRKYSPPAIGSALDPYHYPEDTSGELSATPSPKHESAPVTERRLEPVVDRDEAVDRPAPEAD